MRIQDIAIGGILFNNGAMLSDITRDSALVDWREFCVLAPKGYDMNFRLTRIDVPENILECINVIKGIGFVISLCEDIKLFIPVKQENTNIEPNIRLTYITQDGLFSSKDISDSVPYKGRLEILKENINNPDYIRNIKLQILKSFKEFCVENTPSDKQNELMTMMQNYVEYLKYI